MTDQTIQPDASQERASADAQPMPPTSEGADASSPDPGTRVWAIFRKDPQVLAVSDAEAVLVVLPAGARPPWLPEATALIPPTAPPLDVRTVGESGEVRVRIPRKDLRFAEISGSVLMLQGPRDIPYVLAPQEMAAAAAVVERLGGPRLEHFLADVAKDIGKWNVGMLGLGALALLSGAAKGPGLVPLFEAPWGLAVLLASALGFLLRRPVCYLAYGVLCLGGAVSNAAAHAHGRPGGWVLAALLMAFLGVVTVRRWKQFRHARTSETPNGLPVPGWLAGVAAGTALLGGLLLTVALLEPASAERLLPLAQDDPDLADVALRLPGHVGLVALGLALGSLGSPHTRRLALLAAALAGVLFGHLLAVNLAHGRKEEPTTSAPAVSMEAPASQPATAPAPEERTESRPVPPTRPAYPR